MSVLLGSYAFYAGRGSRASSAVKVTGDFSYRLEPLVVLAEDELGLGDLVANRQPSVSDVVLSAKQLDALSSQTETLNDVVYL